MRTLCLYLCFLLLTVQANSQSQTTNTKRTLHVKGVAIAKQLPELISVVINIKVEANDYSECNDRMMSTLKNAKELFINKGIAKDVIKTNELRVSENKINRNGEAIKSFIGNISLLIEAPYSVEFTNNLLSGLKTDSLSFNYNITFKLSETQKESLRKKAILLAIEDAKEKAAIIAESSKVKLVWIESMSYKDDNNVSVANDNDIMREAMPISRSSLISFGYATSSNPTTDFNPKEIKIVKAVEIDWLIQDENTN